MSFTARIEIRIRPDILDPEADAIAKALHSLGFDRTDRVRRARVIEVDLEAADEATAATHAAEMGRRLLANPVMEDATITVLPRQR